MAKFRKEGKKEVPQVSTSSLPDIVYMLIFFFMITTSMRELTPLVTNSLPKATEVQKLEKKNLVSNIYIGSLANASDKEKSDSKSTNSIQLNDVLFTVKTDADRDLIPVKVAEFIQAERAARTNEEDKRLLTTALKVDKSMHMGVVTDVKQALRQVSAFRITYTAYKGDVMENLKNK